MKSTKVNLANQISSFLVVLKIAGLAPFTSNSRYQTILIVYQGLHLFIIIYLIVGALFLNNAFDESSLSTLVSGLVFIASIVAHAVIILQALVTRKNQQTIIDMLTEIDAQFSEKLMLNVPVKQFNKNYAIKFVVMIIVLLANDIPVSIFKLLFGGAAGYWYSFFSKQILRLRILQCIFYVQMVTDRLELINDKLVEIISSRKSTPNFIILEGEYGKYKHGSKSTHSFDQIFVLKQIFGNIWEVTNIINDCFGWSLLAIAASYFISFTCSAYWLFMALQKLLPQNTILEGLCTIIAVAFMLSSLSWFCCGCKQMSENIGCLVHKLEKSTESEQYNALVSEFSLQIMHEPINLSANGFFTVDFELLGSMIAATVTYLVILIQFLLNEIKHKALAVQNSTEVAVIQSQ